MGFPLPFAAVQETVALLALAEALTLPGAEGSVQESGLDFRRGPGAALRAEDDPCLRERSGSPRMAITPGVASLGW